jgi:hypothetical protein
MRLNINYLLFLAFISLMSCKNAEEKSEALARTHCSTCHSFPEPALLDKKTWETGVFPEMAFRMGLDLSKLPMRNEVEIRDILKAIPDTPLITDEEWNSIKKYYLNKAPDTLLSSRKKETLTLQQFTASILTIPTNNNTISTTIKYDTPNKRIYIATRKGKLYQVTASGELEDSIQLQSPASDILFDLNDKPILTCMGIMDPNDHAAGSVIQLTTRGNSPLTLIDSLKRPVNIQTADLNNDGQKDLVVSAFGNFGGDLMVYEKEKEKYIGHIIHRFPGTRKTIITDFNEDGMPDILALITQGDEQIALFTNRGNFRFSFRILLRFPPVYGSSFFDLHDFNHDGKDDILYTNGDNADYSMVLKPYHGVRIFLNDGKNQFQESLFYPMHGTSMAKAADFDNDGDLDIAAISFFPDFQKHPEQGFIYLENDRGTFKAYTTPLAAASRWLTMEIADFDDDGDVDLILGSLTFPNGVPVDLFQSWKEKPVSLLMLKNNLN